MDYDSLSYSSALDYPLEIDGEVFYPGSDKALWEERQKGNHKRADWAWRWSKKLFDFGYENGFVVVKRKSDGSARIYTKTYLNAKINKLESLLRSPRCPFVLYVGKKKLVKRKEFEKFITDNVEI